MADTLYVWNSSAPKVFVFLGLKWRALAHPVLTSQVEHNSILYDMLKPASVIPVQAFFVYAQIDITEIIMLVSER